MQSAVEEQRVEAARYALLRRLAYAMRHHMVVHLQPIGMITEVLERRLDAAAPELPLVHEAMGKVKQHARAAVQASMDVVGWLAPQDGELVALGDGLAECADMLRSYLAFRGFALRGDNGTLPQAVSRSALRNSLSATLLALTDQGSGPADVWVEVSAGEGEVTLAVTLRPGTGSPGFSGEQHYRRLEWDDTLAIAGAEGVQLARAGDTVTLRLPA